MHPNQTLMAAQAGKHVICEKPMVIHFEDVDRMVKVCEDHGVLLATIFPRRKSPSIP
jgi:UDP-N-acetyl-2-amino-2-deoxyglucuronate dehydrogenase